MITASIVPAEERFNFFPSITKQYVHFEQAIYHFAEQCIEGYYGGYWEFVVLSNGARFCYPKTDMLLRLTNTMNYACESLTGEAAGIALMLMALSRYSLIAYAQGDQEEVDRFAQLHVQLDDYVRHHAEWPSISRFID